MRIFSLVFLLACSGGDSAGTGDKSDGGSGDGDSGGGPGDDGAASAISDIQASAGTLSPPFSADVFQYSLTLPLAVPEVTLTVTAEGEAQLDGAPLSGGAAAVSVHLDGRTVVVANAAGDAAYTIEITRGGEAVAWTEGAAPASEFGAALSADGADLALGSVMGALGAGAVVVYVDGAQQAALSGSAAGEAYGAAVALSGDLLAVGAPGASTGDGAVLLYTRSGTSWTLASTLPSPTTGDQGLFGYALALSGADLYVGAPGADPDGRAAAGAVHHFTVSAGVATLAGSLSPADLVAGEGFGSALALRDGVLAVGAPHGASGGRVARTVDFGTPAWISISGGHAGDGIGAALAFGPLGLLVGAPGTEGGSPPNLAFDAGAAYLVPDAGAAVLLSGEPVEAGARFGSALAAAADLLAVGAPGSSSKAGAVALFGQSDDAWIRRSYPGAAAGDRLGAALAFSHDGLAAGSPYTEDGGACRYLP